MKPSDQGQPRPSQGEVEALKAEIAELLAACRAVLEQGDPVKVLAVIHAAIAKAEAGRTDPKAGSET